MKSHKYVYVKIEKLNVDPIQYKPYAHELAALESSPIYVRVPVSADNVLDGTVTPPTDGIILTPAGLADILSSVAFAIRNKLN